jgi:hypothetical protein
MATCNFWLKNAQSYYAFNNTYNTINDEGEEVEVARDEWDWDDLLDNIRYSGEESKIFDCPSSEKYNRRMDARNICETNTDWGVFGNGNAWTTETNVESVIVIRSGYYAGAVLDYDVKVETSQGDIFRLSEYNNVENMINDYLDTLEDIVVWKGEEHKWNVGTFKLQKKNIRKWIEKRINTHIENCEKFCKENCEMELCVSARFSNGETWYSKVG